MISRIVNKIMMTTMMKNIICIYTYADDTQIYVSFQPDESDDAIQKLELCISKIRMWMIANKLKLNDDKSEFMLITSPDNKKKFDALSIQIGPEIVDVTHSVRNLGVMMDSVLNMEDHVTSVCRSCYFHLRNIGAIRQYLECDTAAQIIHGNSRFCLHTIRKIPP